MARPRTEHARPSLSRTDGWTIPPKDGGMVVGCMGERARREKGIGGRGGRPEVGSGERSGSADVLERFRQGQSVLANEKGGHNLST
eukprot:347492-Rhodomonas_salina.4